MKTYAAPSEFDDSDPSSNIKLFARASWFDTNALDEDNFCDLYATNGYLPCNITLRALKIFLWRAYFSFADTYLKVGYGRTLQGERERLTITVWKSFSKFFKSPIKITGTVSDGPILV